MTAARPRLAFRHQLPREGQGSSSRGPWPLPADLRPPRALHSPTTPPRPRPLGSPDFRDPTVPWLGPAPASRGGRHFVGSESLRPLPPGAWCPRVNGGSGLGGGPSLLLPAGGGVPSIQSSCQACLRVLSLRSEITGACDREGEDSGRGPRAPSRQPGWQSEVSPFCSSGLAQKKTGPAEVSVLSPPPVLLRGPGSLLGKCQTAKTPPGPPELWVSGMGAGGAGPWANAGEAGEGGPRGAGSEERVLAGGQCQCPPAPAQLPPQPSREHGPPVSTPAVFAT